MFENGYIDKLITDIYRGKYSLKRLPKSLYDIYVAHFTKAFETGIDEVEKDFRKSIYQNIRLFSGAKTFQYTYATVDLIYKEGKVVPFAEFKEQAMQVHRLYNETYLKTEYEFANTQAEIIQTWNDETSVNDYLEYVAVLDSKTSEICRPLDGIIRHKNDPFWQTHSPLNHYRCRCTLIGADGEKPSTKAQANAAMKASKVSKELQFNPALAKQIFPTDHGYFDVPKMYKTDLKKNFGL
jgi:SPP1 gp7 family putative phage head morphogenesis protein